MKDPRSQITGGGESVVAHDLPAGVLVVPLPVHDDHRGEILELFQVQWDTGVEPVQWNLFCSAPNVLRGMHVHLRHTDYLIVTSGSTLVGLRDLRAGSPTDGCAALFELHAEHKLALSIPPGVGHAFYCQRRTDMLQGVSHYFDTDDELGCRWSDPDLGIGWPDIDPLLSDRDRDAPSMRELLRRLPPFNAV